MIGLQRLRTAAKPFILSLGTVGVGKLLQIGLVVLMARRMEVAAFGALSVLINTSQILAYLHAAGLSNGATRMVAAFEAQGSWGLLKGFLNFSFKVLLATSVASILIGAVVIALGIMDPASAWFLVALTVISGIGVARSGLSLGLHDVLGALLPREIVAPLLSIAILLLFVGLGSNEVAWIFLFGYVAAEGIGAILLARKVPDQDASSPSMSEPAKWFRVLVPMQAVALMTIALQRMDLIFVGLMFDLHTAALYAAAQRVAQVLNVLARVNAFAVAPQIARAYHSGNSAKVWRTIWFNVGLGAAVGVPICLMIALAAELVMSLFGSDYIAAAGLLVVLSLGQLASAVLGPMTQALTMTAFEREQMAILAALSLLSVPGFWLSGTFFGVMGVALFSVALWVGYNVIALVVAVLRVKR